MDAATGQIRLRCTLAEFQALRPAQETEAVPDLDPTGHGHPDQVNRAPPNPWMRVPRGPGQAGAPQEVTVDSVPPGEVDVRRDLTVCATDGEIGQAQGLVVEAAALTRHQVQDLPPVDIDHPAGYEPS